MPVTMLSRNDVCTYCLRDLYSIATFEGWRLVDLELYVREAWTDYGISPDDLQLWTFGDNEDVGMYRGEWIEMESRAEGWRVTQPPPHHRFTSSDESR
jgi:hypothetical protein